MWLLLGVMGYKILTTRFCTGGRVQIVGFCGFFSPLCCRDPADTILSPKECAVQGELKDREC